jgi:hypothetical protein
MNAVPEDGLLGESWPEFWGERTDANIELLDAFCWQLAVWICERQYRSGLTSPGEHGPERFDGAACEACYDTAFELLTGPLADTFRIFGRAAYEAGRTGESETIAAEAAIDVVGRPACDRVAIYTLLNKLDRGRI